MGQRAPQHRVSLGNAEGAFVHPMQALVFSLAPGKKALSRLTGDQVSEHKPLHHHDYSSNLQMSRTAHVLSCKDILLNATGCYMTGVIAFAGSLNNST